LPTIVVGERAPLRGVEAIVQARDRTGEAGTKTVGGPLCNRLNFLAERGEVVVCLFSDNSPNGTGLEVELLGGVFNPSIIGGAWIRLLMFPIRLPDGFFCQGSNVSGHSGFLLVGGVPPWVEFFRDFLQVPALLADRSPRSATVLAVDEQFVLRGLARGHMAIHLPSRWIEACSSAPPAFPLSR
jgi:hypothetical protein